jgi:tRNA pseudouridine55 synthase
MSNGRVLNLYKLLGETPRERLERLRAQKPQYAGEVLSYAGRLDPMAEGVMLCLVGGENKNREQYLDLSKEYVVDVLLGFSTDSFDILGKVLETAEPTVRVADIRQALNEFRGKMAQDYPPFSSKPVEGRSLWSWARSGAIDALVLPQRTVTVYDIDLVRAYKVKEPALLSYIDDSVGRVQGDFRQEDIMRLWNKHLFKEGTREFPCVTIKVSCSSGTYMRGIANRLGQHLGTPALALHILRTRVGDENAPGGLFTVEKAIK